MYRVLETLGEGGMGSVYRAHHSESGSEAALKLLKPEFAQDEEARERFLREARTCMKVSHPNVVRILAAGEAGGRCYMALELVEGGDAEELLEDCPQGLPEQQALEIVRDCARGLVAIEAAGLVHRDIKPGNIFLTDEGEAKLGDLGLARSALGEDRMTVTGTVVGTPAFMSPEQACGESELDVRTDVYSLGATLYCLLTGKHPFTGRSAWVIVKNVVNEPAPDARELCPSLSEPTHALLKRTLAKSPEDRHRSAQALLNALEAALRGEPDPNPPPLRRQGKRGVEGAPSESSESSANTKLILAALVILLVLAGLGYVLGSQSG